MPEQVYRDLTPELNDIPSETWEDIDPSGLVDFMLRDVPEELREKIASQGLRAVAGAMRSPPLSERAREMLTRIGSTRLIEILDKEQVRQTLEG